MGIIRVVADKAKTTACFPRTRARVPVLGLLYVADLLEPVRRGGGRGARKISRGKGGSSTDVVGRAIRLC